MQNPNLKYGCVIAGTHSGAGKTTWSLALMALARKKGLEVQPFKVGPDYIDPGFHHAICHPRRSRNLDLYLLSENTVKETFLRHTENSEMAIIEGVMGLYDGKGASGQEGSTAQMAKFLNLPVFLVIDGSGMAGSAAALVLGFQKFDSDLKLAGILINRVGSEGHYQWLKRSIEEKTGIPCLGYLPKDNFLSIGERHLGLMTAQEVDKKLEKAQHAASSLESRFDWKSFMKITRTEKSEIASLTSFARKDNVVIARRPKADEAISVSRIGIAYDAAFSFYYEDNFDLLKQAGAELVFFSPLKDSQLPENLNLLYLGGGFPELYTHPLSENQGMMAAIRDFYHSGGFIYAECGGLMFLAEALIDSTGREFAMAGLIPGKVRMMERLQNFGYHEVRVTQGNFLFPEGQILRSHEFHYSSWDQEGKVPALYEIGTRREGFQGERLIASYQHLHFGSAPGIARQMAGIRSWKKNFILQPAPIN
ncbi:MAG: cobyrinate a,c-diamide synthase [Candidatus Omnitrophica bacterium]|nr:cobyrinate a,c-diamide synthase [Candidatus Omnitrophota bacterium]